MTYNVFSGTLNPTHSLTPPYKSQEVPMCLLLHPIPPEVAYSASSTLTTLHPSKSFLSSYKCTRKSCIQVNKYFLQIRFFPQHTLQLLSSAVGVSVPNCSSMHRINCPKKHAHLNNVTKKLTNTAKIEKNEMGVLPSSDHRNITRCTPPVLPVTRNLQGRSSNLPIC